MRRFSVALCVIAGVMAAGLAFAEANPQPSPVNVVLTTAQLEAVNAGRGDVTITFTKEQTEAIKISFPKLTATTIVVNKALVRPGNVIAIVVGARGEANPQPSP